MVVPSRSGMSTQDGRHKEREVTTERNPQIRWKKWALKGSFQLSEILTTRGYEGQAQMTAEPAGKGEEQGRASATLFRASKTKKASMT